MADQQKTVPGAENKKKGFFEGMGLFQKIGLGLVGLGLVYLIFTSLFGGINSFYQLFAFIISAIVLIGLAVILIKAVGIIFAEKYFSPKEDYFTRLVNMAIDGKPSNLQNIYFIGTKDKKGFYGGKIIGCMAIPYLVGTPQLDSEGKWVYYESKLLNMKIPKFEKIDWSKREGDTLFIYEKGSWFNKKRHYLRCAKEFHGDLNGDVAVYSINAVPYGKFWEYPFEQHQRDIGQMMIQSQLEVIVATHDHQGDLISKATDMGLYSNYQYRAMEKQSNEVARDGN